MSPRVRIAATTQQESYEEWYRSHAPFWADHPLFSIYQKLHALGVDLNFLEFLRDVLGRLDSLADNWSRPVVETRGLGMKAVRQWRIRIMEELLASTESSLDPYSQVLLKYSLENQAYVTGARPNRRGTLILTTLIENFRLSVGRNKGSRRRPLWYEAGILLDGFRNQVNKEPKLVVRDRTESRVKKFRRSNPEWQVEARLLIMKFYGIGE